MGSVELIARDMLDGELRTVGLALEPTGSQSGPRPPAIPLPRDLIRMLEAARSRLYFRLWQRRQRRQARRAERQAARQARRQAKAEAMQLKD